MQHLGLEGDPDFHGTQWDKARWPQMRARLAAIFLSRTRDQWQKALEGTDICFAAVLSPPEAAQHPHNLARGVYLETEGVLQTAPAPRFDGQACTPGAMANPGQHTVDVLDRIAAGEAASIWRSPR